MGSFLLHLLLILFCISPSCLADNTITKERPLSDGEILISEGRKFELGFFSPVNSTNRYLGIRYHSNSTDTNIWVANREKPISGRGGVLTIASDGNLHVLDGNNFSVWSTNVSVGSANSSGVLKDSGDFVLSISDDNDIGENVLWHSFNEPTDTFLPGMKVFYGDVPENRVFTSWRSENDPSPGNFSMGFDHRLSPQIIIWNGTNRYWRSGHWNEQIFTGVPSMRFRANFLYGFKRQIEGNKSYFIYTLSNSYDLVRFKICWDGIVEQLRWDGDEWDVIQSQPDNPCDLYNRCGPFGICDVRTNPICSCLKGFVPKYDDEWKKGNWSGGCSRRTELQCQRNGSLIGGGGEGDRFLTVRRVKLPDFLDYLGNERLESCRQKCLRNCSCIAYACVTGINCMIWSHELVDIQHFQQDGETLYFRSDECEFDSKKNRTKVVIIVVVIVGTFFVVASVWLLWRCKSKRKAKLNTPIRHNEVIKFGASKSRDFSTDLSGPTDLSTEGKEGGRPEIPLFNYDTVRVATDEFSDSNKLGQGGFGPVYKGKLPCGQKIAVKRLSRKSGQGLVEFKNELTLIAKLQHRNLVKLLGYCIQGDEKMLLYEYMANKSLDFFLFDPAKQGQLDWMKRYMIIEGIARGLLYLHRDSILRIIHRDLKASNILLDEDMNPKISDFGLARIFGGNQNEENTNRVVGTYGYMAPEYAMEGLFSVKSDVYSFGVLLLEIISGKKNTSFRSQEYSNIVGYAWSLWESDKALDLIDSSMMESNRQDQILRCIHIGMLCVQDLAIHRPNMQSVMLMLESEGVRIPKPSQPTFTSTRSPIDAELWNSGHEITSSGTITITEIIGR